MKLFHKAKHKCDRALFHGKKNFNLLTRILLKKKKKVHSDQIYPFSRFLQQRDLGFIFFSLFLVCAFLMYTEPPWCTQQCQNAHKLMHYV